MKSLVLGLAAASALGLASPSFAADLAARPYTKAPPMLAAVYDWSGFYIGANGGWASSRSCWDYVGSPTARVAAVSEGCHDADGGTAGGQIGYNWQTGSWVFGVDAQGNWADLKGSNDPAAPLPGTTNRSKVDSFGMFTGRIGYAWNNALLYVRGGAAVVHDKYDFGFTGAAAPLSTGSETRWGGTVGAGVEYGFTPNWSAAIDYQHAFMGSRDVTFGGFFLAPTGVVENVKQDLDVVTARINYRWGGPAVARY
ncbi:MULTISPECIES: outer membrane protein [Rhodopseudomonas]|uniref:Membrane protein n=1 Tax=Rhodopseudomonas palustris TaxID=1076 RepID=A0A0D7F3I5_RHOPL|nr:membrane protein [Rhodopseudomonas palustris]